MPSTSVSICLSDSGPPSAAEKTGIGVPRRPSAMTLRMASRAGQLQVQRITDVRRWAEAAFLAVAALAILGIEIFENRRSLPAARGRGFGAPTSET